MFKKIIVLFVFLGAFAGFAQQGADSLVLDPKVKTGKLPNGLTYFIRQNKKPEQKVELRLVINVGSICEDDDQQGLAHMCEHMAFNGTTNFKKNEIVSFLQDIGVGFGNDLNAYTSFDQTVYILPIPTDKVGNLEKGFQVLEDWSHNVTYKDDDIDGERPIILEESRLGKGANDRMFRKIYPRLFAGSRYAYRLPIGMDSIIRTFKYDAIRRFYKEWYRPDLMAVIVVGDIEPAKAEEMIRAHFSNLVNPTKERPRVLADVQPYKTTDAMVVTDKEATGYSVSVNYPAHPAPPSQSLAEYRSDLIKNMFTTMLGQRLQELTQQQNPPFLFAGARFGSYARNYEAFSMFASAGNGDPEKALKAASDEVERLKRFGFTAAELDRAKKNLLNNYERSFNNRDKTESENYVDEYIDYFLEGAPSPGIEKEFDLVKTMLPLITLQDVNAYTSRIKNDTSRFVYLTGPEPKAGSSLPDSTQILAIVNAADKADLKAYEEKAVLASLLKEKPKAGKLVGKTRNTTLGTTDIMLSNGVTVTLKSTDFKNDQVLMTAARPGGKNAYDVADKFNAEYAPSIVSAMGVGEFSPVDLRKNLAGKTASVTPVFTGTSDGFRGNASAKDIESMLQLTYLYATQPRKDTALFHSFVQKNKSQFAMLKANPQTAFVDTMYKALYNNNPLAPIAIPNSDYFDKIDLDKSLAIYKSHFGDASGMHFVVVGSFKEEELIPLLEAYLGALPATKKKFAYVDNKVRPISGIKTLNVAKGKEQKSLILAFYNGETTWSEDMELKTNAMSEILNIKIIEELREKIQGIYGGGTFAGVEKIPYGNYSFVLQLPCGPEKVDTLIRAVNHEFEDIALHGPDQKYLDKVKKQWKEQHRVGMKQNETWLSELASFNQEGKDPKYFLNYEQYVDALKPADVQQVAKMILLGKNRFTAVLMPELMAKPATITATTTPMPDRKVNVLKTIEVKSADIKIDLYDNGDVDGDIVTVYFNGSLVVSKRTLSTAPITLNLRAVSGSENTLVMYADNLGKTPPNTALMKVTADGQVYEVRIESTLQQSGAVNFKLK